MIAARHIADDDWEVALLLRQGGAKTPKHFEVVQAVVVRDRLPLASEWRTGRAGDDIAIAKFMTEHNEAVVQCLNSFAEGIAHHCAAHNLSISEIFEVKLF